MVRRSFRCCGLVLYPFCPLRLIGLVSAGSRWPGWQNPSGSWCPAGGSCLWGAFQRRTSAAEPAQCSLELVAAFSAGRWSRSCWRSDAGLCRWRAAPSAGTLSSVSSGAQCCPIDLPHFFPKSGWQEEPGNKPVAGIGFRVRRNTRSAILEGLEDQTIVSDGKLSATDINNNEGWCVLSFLWFHVIKNFFIMVKTSPLEQ